MSSLYKAFGTNKNYEVEGVVLDFGVCKFKVRRAGGSNRRFSSVMAVKAKPYARAMQANNLDEEKGRRLLQEVYFETVVIDWENVTDETGSELQFNHENFMKVMNDLPDLWATLRDECDKLKNFQDEETVLDGEALGK